METLNYKEEVEVTHYEEHESGCKIVDDKTYHLKHNHFNRKRLRKSEYLRMEHPEFFEKANDVIHELGAMTIQGKYNKVELDRLKNKAYLILGL